MSWLHPGVAVEVVMEEPGLIGSRYPAKVLQVTAGKAKVEIPAFDADEEGVEKLQEWVAYALVSPPPPPAAKDFAKRVKAGDLLDLWHEDGWWKVSVISRPDSSSFEVVAEGYDAVRVVTLDRLRPCLRYVDGEWQADKKHGRGVFTYASGASEQMLYTAGVKAGGGGCATITKACAEARLAGQRWLE